jgi:hypothetical protein
MRAIAVDWSGRALNAGAAIRLAEAAGGRVRRLEGGRGREELVRHLLAEAERDPKLVVGLDFAFSFPEWFVRERAADVFGFWDVVCVKGESWLRDARPPFWRAAGVARLPPEQALRRTEQELRVGGIRPTSVFKLVGAGQVGPGSIRGIPYLSVLRAAGFRIWPFEAAAAPLVVEIWPRALTEAVVKSRHDERVRYLAERVPELAEPLRSAAAATEDAFDAAVSAAVLARHADALLRLNAQPGDALEGRIWTS